MPTKLFLRKRVLRWHAEAETSCDECVEVADEGVEVVDALAHHKRNRYCTIMLMAKRQVQRTIGAYWHGIADAIRVRVVLPIAGVLLRDQVRDRKCEC